jgi:hypothetical protein
VTFAEEVAGDGLTMAGSEPDSAPVELLVVQGTGGESVLATSSGPLQAHHRACATSIDCFAQELAVEATGSTAVRVGKWNAFPKREMSPPLRLGSHRNFGQFHRVVRWWNGYPGLVDLGGPDSSRSRRRRRRG